jgi:hypothetical protein
MTASTRSRLMFCMVLGLITLPAEALLFPVARTPNASVAAVEWAASLDPAELREAAANIDAYPALYRRAIMTALPPADRSAAWREFFGEYIESHPALSTEQVAVLNDAIAVATPEAFTLPMKPELKERISLTFERTQKLLGASTANELFVTLGPARLERANALPFTQRIADSVRSWGVVRAAASDISECNCNIEIDTCDILPNPWLRCSELYTCEFDLTWPMCGPLWSWACTGWCKIIRFPWESSND